MQSGLWSSPDMTTPVKIAVALAACLIASSSSLFAGGGPAGPVPLFSVSDSEACVPGSTALERGSSAYSGVATVGVASLRIPKEASRDFERAEKAISDGKLDDSERVLKKVVETYPNSAVAWCLVGTVHEEKLQFDTASAAYSRSLSADSRMFPAYLGLARIAFRNKQWQDVSDLTDKVEGMNPDAVPVAYLYNAAANLQLGALDKAERSARTFQSLDTDHERPQVCLLLADILIAEQDYAGAADEEKIFLSIVPNPREVANGADAESIREEIEALEARSRRK